MVGSLLTDDAQIEWAGLVLGDGTPYSIQTLTGWEDLPGLDNGSVSRAQQHGAYLGRLLAQARSVALDLTITGQPEDWPTLRAALLTATSLLQDEQPLAVQAAGQQLFINARLTRRIIPMTTDYHLGAPIVSLLWEATDPRRYSLAELTASTGLPQVEAGLLWGNPESSTGLAWGSPESSAGLAWGAVGSTGDITATNSGSAETYPVIEIRGPVTTPAVTLQGAGAGVVLEYDLTLTSTDVLTIDTQAGTVLLGGQSRIGYATARSRPEGLFVLPPGQSTISFRSGDLVPDPAALVTARWRNAYW